MTSRGLDRIETDGCVELLRRHSFGRVGMTVAGEPVILPVYYAFVDGEVVFRTDPGTKLIAAVLETRVAFEVDDAEAGWSVLVVGRAREVRSPAPEPAGVPGELAGAWPPGDRDRVVRIATERITGRRLQHRDAR